VRNTENEEKMMREFAEFVEAAPAAPGRRADQAVLRMVGEKLHPAPWRVYAKFATIEAACGLLTLTVCPQFGLGFSPHHSILDILHSATPPAIFYLLCGILFVIFGAALSALVLGRDEIRTVGKNKYRCFAVYSAVAYLSLMTLGTELFVTASLTWVLGAMLGHVAGFEAIIRLRRPA
jgi:hypothetical protein